MTAFEITTVIFAAIQTITSILLLIIAFFAYRRWQKEIIAKPIYTALTNIRVYLVKFKDTYQFYRLKKISFIDSSKADSFIEYKLTFLSKIYPILTQLAEEIEKLKILRFVPDNYLKAELDMLEKYVSELDLAFSNYPELVKQKNNKNSQHFFSEDEFNNAEKFLYKNSASTDCISSELKKTVDGALNIVTQTAKEFFN